MVAPTLTSQATSTWTDLSSGNEVTGSLSWGSGDRILVVGYTEDAGFTLNTPTATGLTFAALGSPQATASSAWVHCWQATAASPSSSAVTATPSPATTQDRGIQAYAFGGCTGFVRTNGPTPGATQTVSVTRTQANSLLAVLSADWSTSGVTGLGWTPAGQTQRHADTTTNATHFAADWPDQGATGTTSYGTTGLAGTKFTIVAVEVLGTVGVSTPVGPPLVVAQAVNRSFTY